MTDCTHKPKRIQLRRIKGWRKPEGAVVVARPTKWGNHYRIGDTCYSADGPMRMDATIAVAAYRAHLTLTYPSPDLGPGDAAWDEFFGPLRGHDLACWCPLDQPCHADVLLELANAGPDQ